MNDHLLIWTQLCRCQVNMVSNAESVYAYWFAFLKCCLIIAASISVSIKYYQAFIKNPELKVKVDQKKKLRKLTFASVNWPKTALSLGNRARIYKAFQKCALQSSKLPCGHIVVQIYISSCWLCSSPVVWVGMLLNLSQPISPL